MASAVQRKKLCFYADFINASLNPIRVFPLTQFRSTGSYTGDMFGNVLQDLAPLTVGSPGWRKQLNDVALWERLIAATGAVATSTASLRIALDFVTATTAAAAATILQTSLIKTNNPITGAAATLDTDGATPILTRHFAARATKRGSAAATARVMVYARRVHSYDA